MSIAIKPPSDQPIKIDSLGVILAISFDQLEMELSDLLFPWPGKSMVVILYESLYFSINLSKNIKTHIESQPSIYRAMEIANHLTPFPAGQKRLLR